MLNEQDSKYLLLRFYSMHIICHLFKINDPSYGYISRMFAQYKVLCASFKPRETPICLKDDLVSTWYDRRYSILVQYLDKDPLVSTTFISLSRSYQKGCVLCFKVIQEFKTKTCVSASTGIGRFSATLIRLIKVLLLEYRGIINEPSSTDRKSVV